MPERNSSRRTTPSSSSGRRTASPSLSGSRRSRHIGEANTARASTQTTKDVLAYYSMEFKPEDLTCHLTAAQRSIARGGGNKANRDVRSFVRGIFDRWNCIRNDPSASPVVNADDIHLAENPLFDESTDEPGGVEPVGVEPVGATTFESLPADALLLILDHLRNKDILELMRVNTTVRTSVREQFQYIKPTTHIVEALALTYFATLIQNVYSMCIKLKVDTFHLAIWLHSEGTNKLNRYKKCISIQFKWSTNENVHVCDIQISDTQSRPMPGTSTVITTDTKGDGNLQFDYTDRNGLRRFVNQLHMVDDSKYKAHMQFSLDNGLVSIWYHLGAAMMLWHRVWRSVELMRKFKMSTFEPVRILFRDRMVESFRQAQALYKIYKIKHNAPRWTTGNHTHTHTHTHTREPMSTTARVDSTVSTNTRPQYFTVADIKRMRNAGFTHRMISTTFRDGRLTAAHPTAVANRNAMTEFAGVRMGGSSSKSTWTSTGGRKAACADGIERTLWKNTATGELRVKRFVRRRDNGKAIAAYFPA